MVFGKRADYFMKKINIILDHKADTSITRLAVMYANHLVEKGYNVTVNYPLFSWYRYELFYQNINENSLKFKILLIKRFVSCALRKEFGWAGEKNYKLSKMVKLNKYLYKPTKYNISDSDYILIFQSQLLLDLIDFPENKGEIIDSLHTGNFLNDSDVREWFLYLTKTACKRVSVKRFASSSRVKAFYAQFDVRVDRVIYNGIDLIEFKPTQLAEKAYDFLMFSDVKKAKGYDFGVQVIKELKAQNLKLKFNSIGRNVQGLDTTSFDNVYKELKEKDYAEEYGKHLFFLYPSLYDGFPAPPLEAMASGAVCILAKVAGVDEYAVDGENCMLCEPGNLDEFVNKIKRLLSDPELCEKLSQNAANTAKRFSWDNSTNELIDLMNQK